MTLLDTASSAGSRRPVLCGAAVPASLSSAPVSSTSGRFGARSAPRVSYRILLIHVCVHVYARV